MGDQISAIKLAELVESHKKSRAIATVALIKHRIPLEYGVAKLNAKGEVKEFAEKPIIENYLNTAMYVFEPKIFDYIKENGDFARDVFPRLLAKGERINGCVFEDSFFDIGRISDYDKINEMFKMIRLGNSLDL
jgi:NDP-sugar pyrophosphorylase family protein